MMLLITNLVFCLAITYLAIFWTPNDTRHWSQYKIVGILALFLSLMVLCDLISGLLRGSFFLDFGLNIKPVYDLVTDSSGYIQMIISDSVLMSFLGLNGVFILKRCFERKASWR